jgi:hypothetical protein
MDETKMGKRKFKRGYRVEGAWVIVGIELTEERRVFAEVVPDRSLSTIVGVMSRHLVPGSELHTDCWRAYGADARIFGLVHKTVNHSLGFKNNTTGIDTNTVEGTNCALKRTVPVRNRTASSLEQFLSTFIWRRLHDSDL